LPHSSTTDDGFREIQLNGKQLVFLFMAATVVSVAIFLCGVLVGRGVRPVSPDVSAVASSESVMADVLGGSPAPPAVSSTTPRATSEAAALGTPATELPPTPDELTYYDRLEKDTPPTETLKPAIEPPRSQASKPQPARSTGAAANRVESAAAQKPASPVEESQSPIPNPQSPQTSVVIRTSGEPAGSGYAVQVAALRAKREADAVAKRLAGKGYPAYVMAPSAGTPAAVYRVRVGKFNARREAEQVAARLEREEKFKPWIVR
jgi:cell division protein FtsN